MVISRIGWFEKLMALALSVLTLLMFFAVSGANHASIRDVDSTIGLLRRPSNSKIVKNFKAFISPVKANAQFAVKIISDLPRLLEQILNKALKTALSALIKAFLNAIMQLFDQLVSAIEGWVGTIDGLRDAIGAFRGAVALKAYQVEECLIQSTESFVNDILPPEDQSNHNPTDKCNGLFGSSDTQPASEANKVINNAASNHFTQVAIAASQEGVPQSETIPNLPSKSELEVQRNEIATSVALAGCLAGQAASSNSVLSGGILPAGDITALRSGCKQEINDTKEAFNQKAEQVEATTQKTVQQTVTAAPADCQEAGYISGLSNLGSVSDATFAADSIQFGGATNVGNGFSVSNDLLNGASFGDALEGATFSFADSSLKVADEFNLETLNNEQCSSANRMPSVLASAQANSAGSSGNEFDFDAIVSAFIDAFAQFITNIINKVFTVLTEAINNFLRNAPGGEYLSQAISNVIDPIQSAVTADINNIADRLIDDITNGGSNSGNSNNNSGPVDVNNDAILNPIG